ncbi:MAG: protein-tyrosine-phosphatase [Flavobacterium sp.]|nr:protein-tyrosine-phosphatase [Flavobacterium sp.]
MFKNNRLYPEIEKFAGALNYDKISNERKSVLQPLIDYIENKHFLQKEIRLNFICTHNSRRSHISQVWAQTAATYYDIQNVYCYSGGTEATALYPMTAESLANSGFQIRTIAQGENPIYAIKYGENEHPIIGFSKKYDASFNPSTEFAAIMTCSHADGGCPFIAGAEKRIVITYDDPKFFDGTPLQAAKYNERSLQIATELFYVFSKIK